MRSVSLGFVLLVICLWCLLAQTNLVAVLSFVKSWLEGGRFLQCEFVYRGKSFRVISLYAPNRNLARHDFFERVPSLVDPSVPTVVCGNFNAVFDRSLDRFGSDTADISTESSVALSHLFESCCCVHIISGAT